MPQRDMVPSTELEPVLARFPAAGGRLRIEPLGAAGGMSGALFWRVTSAGGMFALRRWPPEHPTPERLRFIHASVRHAFARGCTVLPIPSTANNGDSFIEHASHRWELSPWMPGEADYERFPSTAKLAASLAALARFHNAAADFPVSRWPQFATDSNAVAKRLTRLRNLQAGGIAQLERSIDASVWPALAPLAREFVAILPRSLPKALAMIEPLAGLALPLQPCLRDIWHDHLLFTGEEVTGLIDFGAMDVDTPATDVARLLGSLAGDDAAGWQIGLAAYSAVRPLSPHERQAVTALDAAGTLLAGCNWIRWIYIEGRQFENQEQVLERFRRIGRRVGTAQHV